MNKKGQIYILVALLLGIILFMLVSQTNIIVEWFIEDDFETLSKNYDIESAKFMNSLLAEPDLNPEYVSGSFLKFTRAFTAYSKNQNPSFGLIYLFDFGGNLNVGNYLSYYILVDENYLEGCFDRISSTIEFEGLSVDPGFFVSEYSTCNLTLPSKDKVNIVIGDIIYEVEITKNVPNVMIISREVKEEQRKVYLNKEFIKGRKGGISGTGYCSGFTEGTYSCTWEECPCDCTQDLCIVNCGNFYNAIESREACEDDTACCWNLEDNVCDKGEGEVC